MNLQVRCYKQEIEYLRQRNFSLVCAQLSGLKGLWMGITIRAVMVDRLDTDVLSLGIPEGVID